MKRRRQDKQPTRQPGNTKARYGGRIRYPTNRVAPQRRNNVRTLWRRRRKCHVRCASATARQRRRTAVRENMQRKLCMSRDMPRRKHVIEDAAKPRGARLCSHVCCTRRYAQARYAAVADTMPRPPFATVARCAARRCCAPCRRHGGGRRLRATLLYCFIDTLGEEHIRARASGCRAARHAYAARYTPSTRGGAAE